MEGLNLLPRGMVLLAKRARCGVVSSSEQGRPQATGRVRSGQAVDSCATLVDGRICGLRRVNSR